MAAAVAPSILAAPCSSPFRCQPRPVKAGSRNKRLVALDAVLLEAQQRCGAPHLGLGLGPRRPRCAQLLLLLLPCLQAVRAAAPCRGAWAALGAVTEAVACGLIKPLMHACLAAAERLAVAAQALRCHMLRRPPLLLLLLLCGRE